MVQTTELKYLTINTPEWPNAHNLKIQDGGGRRLEFRKKNVNKFGLDKDLCAKVGGQIRHGHAERLCVFGGHGRGRRTRTLCIRGLCVDM